jgi:hypothetical protein
VVSYQPCRPWSISKSHGLMSCQKWTSSYLTPRILLLGAAMAFVHVGTLHGKSSPSSYTRGIILSGLSELVSAPTRFSSFISASSPSCVRFRHTFNWILSCSPVHVVSVRYLDPDPLLLAAPHGSGDEVNSVNPRFHALNQALVQLVSRVIIWHTRYQSPLLCPCCERGCER